MTCELSDATKSLIDRLTSFKHDYSELTGVLLDECDSLEQVEFFSLVFIALDMMVYEDEDDEEGTYMGRGAITILRSLRDLNKQEFARHVVESNDEPHFNLILRIVLEAYIDLDIDDLLDVANECGNDVAEEILTEIN